MKQSVTINTRDLKYRVHEIDKKNPTLATPAKITAFLLRQMANMKWPQQMPRTDARIWGNIQDIIIDDPTSFTLDGTEFEWLLKTLKEWEAPAQLASWVNQLEDYLEGLKASPKLVEKEA